MKTENILTDNKSEIKIKVINTKVTNIRLSTIRILARVLGLKLIVLNNEFVLLLNTISTKIVFATRNTLHKSMRNLKNTFIALNLEIPAGLKKIQNDFALAARSERGDVPGWVLVVLMTTGLVTGIWTVAQPRLSSILKNSLDNMNSIR
jgi:hypothetical protein